MAFAENKTLCIGQFVKINSVTSVQHVLHTPQERPSSINVTRRVLQNCNYPVGWLLQGFTMNKPH